METKVCFKCKVEKQLSEFYKHKAMGDGYLGKCKECAKNDVKLKYQENIQNDDYIEKERLRCRTKYAKYKYKNKIQHPENKNTYNFLLKQGFNLTEKETHHWNYNLKNDVFILNPRAHKLVHKYITFDKESNMFKRNSNGALLDTKAKHFFIIKAIFIKHNINYEIDTYPTF